MSEHSQSLYRDISLIIVIILTTLISDIYYTNRIEQLEKQIQWQHDRTTKIVHDLNLESRD